MLIETPRGRLVLQADEATDLVDFDTTGLIRPDASDRQMSHLLGIVTQDEQDVWILDPAKILNGPLWSVVKRVTANAT